MRILIIRNYPSFMDLQYNTYNIQEIGLAKALVRRGHECDIVFWTDAEEKVFVIPVDCGIVHVFYKKGKNVLKNVVYTGCEQLFAKYDLLQPTEYNQIQSWILARKYPNKTIIYHGPYRSSFNKRYNFMCCLFDCVFLRSYIKRNTRFIVKSRLAEKFLLQKGIQKKNIEAAGVGIDKEMLIDTMIAAEGDCNENCNEGCNENCNEDFYKKMAADDDELKILYIGCFERRRNLPFILEVFAKIYLHHSNARLYLIGTGDSDYMEMVWRAADRMNIRDVIVYQDKMEQRYLSEIYKLSDFFLLPTEYEIFGMVLLEAMYYGVIVLTTYHGGSDTLIDHKENGFIFYDFDSDLWADCILGLIKNKEKMYAVSKAASAAVSDYYTWDALAGLFIAQYELMMYGS